MSKFQENKHSPSQKLHNWKFTEKGTKLWNKTRIFFIVMIVHELPKLTVMKKQWRLYLNVCRSIQDPLMVINEIVNIIFLYIHRQRNWDYFIAIIAMFGERCTRVFDLRIGQKIFGIIPIVFFDMLQLVQTSKNWNFKFSLWVGDIGGSGKAPIGVVPSLDQPMGKRTCPQIEKNFWNLERLCFNLIVIPVVIMRSI